MLCSSLLGLIPLWVQFFANETGMTECRPCSKTTFSIKIVGSPVGPTNCTMCSPGRFSADEKQSECKPCSCECPLPRWCWSFVESALTPSVLAAGSYQPLAAASSCKSCELGKSQLDPGKTSCNNCTRGQFAGNGGRSGERLAPISSLA